MSRPEFYATTRIDKNGDTVETVHIRVPVDENNVVDRPARLEDFERYSAEHDKFLAGQAGPDPLDVLEQCLAGAAQALAELGEIDDATRYDAMVRIHDLQSLAAETRSARTEPEPTEPEPAPSPEPLEHHQA